MRCYEITFIARHDMSKPDVQKLTDQYVKLIEDGKGKVVKQEYWGLRNLAYKINKNGKGHYTLLGIEAPFDVLSELERQLRLNEDVVRNLTVKVDTIDSKPSPMMRSERGDDADESDAA